MAAAHGGGVSDGGNEVSDGRNRSDREMSGILRTKENAVKPITVSVADAVTMTGLSVPTIYRMMKAKEIDSFTIGRRRLIRVDSINKLLGVA